MTSPIYHPPSNGQAENSVRTCKKMLKCILNDNLPLYKINELLLGYLFDYRNTVHCTTGETPSKLMFGRNLRSRLDLVLPSEENKHVDTSLVRIRRQFAIGDLVWTRWYSARHETWQLGIIKNKIGNKMYNIYIKDLELYCIRHVDQMLKYTGNNEPTNTNNVTVPHREQSPDIPNSISSAVAGETDNVPVAPDTECVDIDEDEWRDCQEIENEGRMADGIASSAPPAEQPETFVTEAEGNQSQITSDCNVDEIPVPSPPSSRSLRPRKMVDYKKYF